MFAASGFEIFALSSGWKGSGLKENTQLLTPSSCGLGGGVVHGLPLG